MDTLTPRALDASQNMSIHFASSGEEVDAVINMLVVACTEVRTAGKGMMESRIKKTF